MFSGFENKFPAEQLYISFCKFVLGVHKKATNITVRCELGTFSIILQDFREMLKYRLRISLFDSDHLMSQVYKVGSQMEANKCKNWFQILMNIE